MPKMKSHSSAKKRFTLTASGKVKRSAANARHLMRKKTKKTKRHLEGTCLVDVADTKRAKRMLAH